MKRMSKIALLICCGMISSGLVLWQCQQKYTTLATTKSVLGSSTEEEEEEEEEEQVPCHVVPELVSNASNPQFVIELRRKLGLSSPSCLDKHFDTFAQAFLDRPRQKHLNLHIPKAGGTTVCEAVRKYGNMSTPGNNCWTQNFCPIWCCCDNVKPTSCQQLHDSHLSKIDFVMNENWFDGFCEGRTYSMMLREPVSRAISHVNHFTEFLAAAPRSRYQNSRGWRLNLAFSNYMTWSLTAQYNETGNPGLFRPQYDDLVQAKRVVRQMDFLVDLSFPNETCNRAILKLMGITSIPVGTSKLHANVRNGSHYQAAYDREVYKLVNALDISLYEYAQSLMTVDCAFFLDLIQRYPQVVTTDP